MYLMMLFHESKEMPSSLSFGIYIGSGLLFLARRKVSFSLKTKVMLLKNELFLGLVFGAYKPCLNVAVIFLLPADKPYNFGLANQAWSILDSGLTKPQSYNNYGNITIFFA